jgi:nucleoside-diphosphate-sugar epimerase
MTHKAVLVTGGTGFIGRRVVEQLRAVGTPVHVLARSLTDAPRLHALGCHVFRGDVTIPQSVTNAMTGCQYVVHCAVGGGDMTQARAINVEGTRHLLDAARSAGVHRVVFLSSVVAHGRRWPTVLTEDAPLATSGDPYVVSKTEAERMAFAFARNSGLEVTIVRPTIVYGPWSGRIVTDLQRVAMERVRLVAHGRGVLNAVYVDDLVDGIVLALGAATAANDAFLVSGPEPTTWRSYYDHLARMCGKPSPAGMSTWSAQTAAFLAKWRFRFTRRPSVFDDGDFALMDQPGRVSIEKAKRAFGYRPCISLDEGMRRTESWLRERGYLPAVAA